MTKDQPSKVSSKKHLARLERERIQRGWIIRVSIAVIIIVVGVLGYGILDQTVLRENKPVAKVAGEAITVKEFTTLAKFYRYQLIQQYTQTQQFSQMFGTDESYASYFQSQLQQIQNTLGTPNTLGQNVLDQLIEDKLIRQEAKKRGINVTKEEVDKAIHDAFGFYPDGTPTPEPTEAVESTPTMSKEQSSWVATLTPTVGAATPTSAPTEEPTAAPTATSEVSPTASAEELTPTATPTEYTLEGFEKEFKTYADNLTTSAGLTETDLRWVYESDLYRKKLQDSIAADLKPEQDQVWARHILVDTEEEAKTVLDRLSKGENFISLAQELSKDTGTKDNGGDLGWFGPGKMVQAFNDAAFSLTVGEISQPIKTDYGYHIIQVLGHEVRKLDSASFTTLKDTAFSDWLKAQKEAIEITQYDSTWQENVPTEPSLTQ